MIGKEDEPPPAHKNAEHDIEEAIERSYGKKMTDPLRHDNVKSDRGGRSKDW